jgi:ribose transport system permease protein
MSRSIQVIERVGLVLVFAAMFLYFALDGQIGSLFLSAANLRNLLISGAVVGVIALAMLPPLIAGFFDLSVAAIAGVSSVAAASAISKYGVPLPAGIVIGIACGVLLGTINGFLIARLGLNAFITTFGTYVLLGGLATWYTGGEQIVANIPASVGAWSGESWLGLPKLFVVLAIISLVVWFALSYLPWGRYLQAIGSNSAAARLVGIRVDRTIFSAFVITGTLAGVAGVMQLTIIGGADPTAAASYLFPAFAAVFLGATVIKPGRYNVWGTIIGVYFVGTAVSGLSLLGAQTWVQPVFNGAALLAAIALATFLGRMRNNREARINH